MIDIFLLSDDDQVGLRLLEEMAENPTSPALVSELQADLNLSAYKINRLYDQLNEDLSTVTGGEAAYVEKVGGVIWRLHGVTREVIEKIRLLYLKRSYLFPAFEYFFLYSRRVTKTAFIKERFLSNAKFYTSMQELQRRLENGPKLRMGRGNGNAEFDTRLFLFQFYYLFFNGQEEHFPELTPLVSSLTKQLTSLFGLTLTPTQTVKLDYFLQIWLMRLKNEQPLGDAIRFNEILVAHPKEIEEVRRTIPAEIKLSPVEFDYLYTFLVTQEYLDECALHAKITPKRYTSAHALAKQFVKQLTEATFFKPLSDDEKRILTRRIFRLNVQMSTFYLPPMIYLRNNKTQWLRRFHPGLDALVTNFLSAHQKEEIFGSNPMDLASFYYSYLFLLLSDFPAHKFVDLVHVCVDFSQGPFYSNYIAQRIRGLSLPYVKIDTRVTQKTAVYLSDYPVKQGRAKSIVWSNPPSDDDWRTFVDVILELRRKQVCAVDCIESEEIKDLREHLD